MDFNAVVSQQKLALLQTIQFPHDQQSGNVPAIASLSRTARPPGSTVVINGSNFGTTQGTSVVRFNTTNATVTPLSASQIAVTVPNVTAGPYSVIATVNGVSSNAATFKVPVADNFPPAISTLSPASESWARP